MTPVTNATVKLCDARVMSTQELSMAITAFALMATVDTDRARAATTHALVMQVRCVEHIVKTPSSVPD